MSKVLRQFFLHGFILILISFFILKNAQAQNRSTLRINQTDVSLRTDAIAWLDSFSKHSKSTALVVVQLEATVNPAMKAGLEEQGIRLQQSLSGNYFLASIQPNARLAEARNISAVTAVQPQWKLATSLREQNARPGAVDVALYFAPGTNPEDIKKWIESAGGLVKYSPLAEHSLFEVQIQGTELPKLLERPELLYASKAAVDRPLNLESQRATRTSIVHASPANNGWGLLGDGITIGVGDNVPGMWHVDLRDRITNYNPQPYANHGQHTNGTAGGAGTMDPRGEGFAPHAQLVDFLYSLVWTRTADMLASHRMTVTNNSYANVVGDCSTAGVYDSYSQILDSFMLKYPVFHVFASGNDGGMTCAPFPTSFGTVTGGYQVAKNVLVVGNATKQYEANPGTSRGPVRDGRLKPEIAAIGSDVYSTTRGDGYLSAFGTSMACPQVSGAAGLMQQRYQQAHGGTLPETALLKALLMNGAMDAGLPGPDFSFGFGIMDLRRSLIALDSNWYLMSGAFDKTLATPITIQVPPGTGQLKVMLYWHDLPSSPMSSKQLITDLDLNVQSPDQVHHLPLIANPAPNGVAQPALQGQDHLNNVEQVVIDHPAAGQYPVQVYGFSVPSPNYPFTIVYDLIPGGITLTMPWAGGTYKSGDALTIYWEASPGTNTFRIEFSEDDGQNWALVADNVPSNARNFLWNSLLAPNSSQCRMRILRNGTSEQFVSERFTMNTLPDLRLSDIQCPGYAALEWDRVPNADSFLVLQKKGPFLQPRAFVRDTFFAASGLNPDSVYYFAVQPFFGAQGGYRSMGISRRPDSGSCSGSISDGDLMLTRVVAPKTGRVGTSTELTSNETLRLEVRNLDDQTANRFRVLVQVNSGATMSQTYSGLAANSSVTLDFPGMNFSAPGSYRIIAVVENLDKQDRASGNDSLDYLFRQLSNSPMNLTTAFLEGFEQTSPLQALGDTVGFAPALGGDPRWDYSNSNDTGRLRTFVDDGICISGNRSISMDMQQAAAPVLNLLTGTFNLNAFNVAADELRMDFDYRLHGHPKSSDSNKVWVRGSDTSLWTPLFIYDRITDPGTILNSGTRSLNDALAAVGQRFSRSTQIAFGQFDSSVIADLDYGNGLTLDNIRIYRVVNDAGIASILHPAPVNCSLTNDEELSVDVYNGVNNNLHNVMLYYQLDGAATNVDTLDDLPGKSHIAFNFSKHVDLSAYGPHTLRVWLSASGDTYNSNDTLADFQFYNEPLISAFPYFQDFENGAANWYSGGKNSSWAFGHPAGSSIRKAASGVNAWKTNLTGTYNNNELSYLYSPCFNVSSLSNPMLSFAVNMEIENCGETLCDAVWIEYSFEGGEWTKLGAAGDGTNWYSDNDRQVWKIQSPQRWRVASIPLPAGSKPIRFRFVFSSDPGLTLDGIAIDDIHIYDLKFESYTQKDVGPIKQTFSGSGFQPITFRNLILAELDPLGKNMGETSLWYYHHDQFFDQASSQYYLPANFVLQSQQPADSMKLRLYVTDDDVEKMVFATDCAECDQPEDVYGLGVTGFRSSDRQRENNTLADNLIDPVLPGAYRFTAPEIIRWIPYDAGYYAEYSDRDLGELWFNTGGALKAFPLTKPSIDFQARKEGDAALLQWSSTIDTAIARYEIWRSDLARDSFIFIANVNGIAQNGHLYRYSDRPGSVQVPAFYYRLRYFLKDGEAFYAPLRQVIWSGRKAEVQLYPNPPINDEANITWTCKPGDQLDVVVTDISGKQVAALNSVAGDYYNRTLLNVSAWAKGMYFLHARVNGERFVFKMMVP